MCGSDGAQEIWLRQVNELVAGAGIKQEEALRALRTEHQQECTTIPRNTSAHILQLQLVICFSVFLELHRMLPL